MTARGLAALVAAAAALGGGCDLIFDPGASEAAGGRERGETHTLIVGKPADAIGLDPARITDNESVEICEQIYEHLVRFAPSTTEVIPSLAKSWEVSDDGELWTFHLRPGVRFHDGAPLDADAVVFSFERQRDPRHPQHEDDFAYWDGQYRYIERITAKDPLTVEIQIERPFAPFLSSLAMFPVSIVSPAAVLKWGATYPQHPVGTGPFRLGSWVRGERIVLDRNDEYWGEHARFERIVFRNIPEGRQRLVALEAGAVDVAYAILPEELQYVQLHPDLRLHRVASQNVTYVAMNTMRDPFDDVRVRHAVNHAVNKEPIVKLVYQGLAVPASGAIPPTLWSYHEGVTRYDYDPAKARALLAEAGYDGKPVRFFVPTTPRPYLPDPEQVGRVIKRNLTEAGLEVELVLQDFSAHLSSVERGEHDLCLFGWSGDIPDPDNFLYVLLDRDNTTPGIARNVAFYQNSAVHGLLRYAQETTDQEERTRFYRNVQEIVAEDAPWVPLAHSELAIAAREEVEGIILHPSALVFYQGVWLDR